LEFIRNSAETGTSLGNVLMKFAGDMKAGKVLPVQRRPGVLGEKDAGRDAVMKII